MGVMENEKDIQYDFAKKRVRKIRNFYLHLTAFVFVNGFIILLNTRHQSIADFLQDGDNLRNLGLWGIVLVIHGISIFGPALLLGKDWEERKVRELMEKNKPRRWE